jgi:hypothetical protein
MIEVAPDLVRFVERFPPRCFRFDVKLAERWIYADELRELGIVTRSDEADEREDGKD